MPQNKCGDWATLAEVSSPLYHMVAEIRTWAIRLGGTHLHLLGQLARPTILKAQVRVAVLPVFRADR